MAADVEKAFQRSRDLNVTLSSEEVQAAKISLLEDLITQGPYRPPPVSRRS